MSEAPERIWAGNWLADVGETATWDTGEWRNEPWPTVNVVEYVRADRIEELEAQLAEQVEWVKGLADDLIAAEGREARLKDKLAKVIRLADAMAEAIKDQIDTCDASMDEQVAVKNYRTALAELTGGKDGN